MGAKVNVLSGEEEGRLAFRGAVGSLAALVFFQLETLQIDHQADHRRQQQHQQAHEPQGGSAHTARPIDGLAVQEIEVERARWRRGPAAS